MKRMLALLAGLLLLVAGQGTAADESTVRSGAETRSDLSLTIYNHGSALVREVRQVDLPDGLSFLEFADVPTLVDPRTLLVETDGRPLRLMEQNYEFDLMSREKILEKYVGRELAWIQEDGRRVSGRLLGMARGPVFEVDGEVVFEVPGRLALPSLPENLRARPTLVWKVDARGAGRRGLDVSYLSGGISWAADYVLQLDRTGKTGDLQAWVSVDNRSGAAYADAQILLLAGDVHRAGGPPEFADTLMEMRATAAYAPGVKEETVSDYHLYTLPDRVVLKDASVKQLSLFTAQGVRVHKRYRVDAGAQYFQRQSSGAQKQTVRVYHEFENDSDNGLGLPLPGGVVRVYGESSSGARQLLGEDRIDHTPREERISLYTGDAFDLVVERTHTDYRKRGDRVFENAFRVSLRNRGETDVTIELDERAGGEWAVIQSTHDPVKVDAHSFRFDVPVKAGGETVLEYRVVVTY